jgi:transcriptional regulator with XRE-family HTH domain
MTGTMVGRAIGVSQQQISKQEHGTSQVTVSQLRLFAELYGRTLDQIVREMELDNSSSNGFTESEAAPFLVESSEPMVIDLAVLTDPLDRRHLLRHYHALKRRSAR